jgi:hypothetical protein
MLESRSERCASNAAPRANLARYRVLGVAAGTTFLLLAGLMQPQFTRARGGTDDPPRSDSAVQPPAPASRSEFVTEIRRTLATQYDRMSKLADQAFRYEETSSKAQDQLPSQKSLVESAQAKYEIARLAREVAEIKVREFTDGQFVQDLAEAEAEIKLAEEDITFSREATKQAEDRRARIKKASTGSVGDLSYEFGSEAKVRSAQLSERRAEVALEQAKNKKEVLLRYTKGKRTQELQRDVESARSEELMRKRAVNLEKTKQYLFDSQAKKNDPPPDAKRVLLLLDDAISVQEQIRGKLEHVTRDEKLADSLRSDLQDLTSRLRAIVEEAAGDGAALQFDKLKPQIHHAASRTGFGTK